MSEKSPSFEGNLKASLQARKAPTSRALPRGARRVVRQETLSDPHFKKSFKRSLVLHVCLAATVVFSGLISKWFNISLLPWSRPVEMAPSKTAIRVDLVDLPSIKVSELHKIDALDKIADQEPAPVSDTTMVLKEKPEVVEAKKLEAEKEKKAESQKSAKQRLKELQANLRSEVRRKELMDQLKGDMAKKNEGGRPLLSGNQLSAGYATQGELATATDAYNGKLRQHLRQHWQVPGWMTVSKLRARVIVKIAPDGRVIEKTFVQTSGNTEFDTSVDQALTDASPFPAPEPELARVYMEEGVEWGFPE